MRKYQLTASDLVPILSAYRRWILEGKPPHGTQYDAKNRKPQWYYDPYHDHISESKDGTFNFSVQTYDSPEGDTWVCGKFKIEHDRIIILEQHAEAR